ncbi:hypothetical protein HK105_200811 [Polyrhizophydium stewartii]|uniref:Eukaryotic translation initiation factor 3 subunit G n=1 Tax=Polyrhizophydium stewartii TaxID=2732419 RepID=A0ABR4NKD9_9FUNG
MSIYLQVKRNVEAPASEYKAPPDTGFEAAWVRAFVGEQPPAMGSELRERFFPQLGTPDPDEPPAPGAVARRTVFLAHGSYGAVPTPVLETACGWMRKIEHNPVHFYYDLLFPYLVRSLRESAELVGALPTNVVLVTNVEFGIAAVLRSLELLPGDRLLALDFNYEAVLYALEEVAARTGAVIVRVPTTMPITQESIVRDVAAALDAPAAGKGPIKLAVFEHITSPTGQVDLDLEALGADYYVTNPHKWLCNARGCALLYVSRQHHARVHPVITTWGTNKGMHAEFVWQGTADYSTQISLAMAVRFFRWLGTSAVTRRNRDLALRAGDLLARVWGTHTLSSDPAMTASMAVVRVPDVYVDPAAPAGNAAGCADDTCSFSNLHDELLARHGVEVPVFVIHGQRYVRVSVHFYNDMDDVAHLARAMLAAQRYPPTHEAYDRLRNAFEPHDTSNKSGGDWGDAVDTPDNEPTLPPSTRTVEPDGTTVVTTYSFSEKNEIIKNVKRIRKKLVKTAVNHAVAERKKWKKFGESAGLPAGPDTNSTSLGEVVFLKLSWNTREQAKAAESEAKTPALAGNTNIMCRICKGEHWTTKCPYKDTYKPINEIKDASDLAKEDKAAGAGPSKYVAPGARSRAAGGPDLGTSMRTERRDDANTIRISNLSEDTTEDDVRALVSKFGSTSRVFVAWDRDLGVCKGFAFVGFYDKSAAERAIEKLNGYGYDNLILRVEWSKRD